MQRHLSADSLQVLLTLVSKVFLLRASVRLYAREFVGSASVSCSAHVSLCVFVCLQVWCIVFIVISLLHGDDDGNDDVQFIQHTTTLMYEGAWAQSEGLHHTMSAR